MPRRPEPPLDPFERAARRADPQYARLAEAADAQPPRSLRATRLLALFAVLVVAAVVVRGGGSGPPTLTRSCTTAGFALSRTTVDLDAPLQWSATGPATSRVVLALDSPQLLPAEPVDGPAPLRGCLARGSFPMQAHTGRHTLTLFVVTPEGRVTARLTESVTVR